MYRLLLFVLLTAAPLAAQPADYVVTAARVYTADPAQPEAEAFAVRDGRLLMVGTTDELLTAYPDAERVDLPGRTVVPGLIDAHAHLMGLGQSLLSADLVGTSSKDEVLARLREAEAALPAGAWLTGRGWDQNDWPAQDGSYPFPTREDLDAAFPERPVYLVRIDGHAAWANTAALEAASMDRIRTADDPEGGRIVRNAQGEPTGVFIDAAMGFVESAVPEPTAEEEEEMLRRALEQTAQHGLTGVHEAGVPLRHLRLYQRKIDEGAFPLRLYAMADGRGASFDHLCEEGPILGYGGRLTARAVKFYLDGALGSRGAALLEDYSDAPGERGLLFQEPAAFQADVEDALRCGFQVNTHVIGDRGARVALDAYEAAAEAVGGRTVGRHRLEHAQVLAPSDIPRFAEQDIIASMQPTHATSDMPWAEERLGEERIQGAYAWRSLMDSGARLAFGSDFPVEQVSPLLGFYAAVTRQDAEGQPEGGWLPAQRLTREEALRAFTLDAAYAAFQEDDLGSLTPGKRADFVVLDQDIMTVPAPEILRTQVVATYLDGEPIYVQPHEE